ncbi:hypothetical protein ND856_19485, partial [Leptospira bandrabouensis]|uniref:hypothetical protein n=1 Tax=Leptospira bandrabouensis TaxID=2484903 RepID=UPI00223D580E
KLVKTEKKKLFKITIITLFIFYFPYSTVAVFFLVGIFSPITMPINYFPVIFLLPLQNLLFYWSIYLLFKMDLETEISKQPNYVEMPVFLRYFFASILFIISIIPSVFLFIF